MHERSHDQAALNEDLLLRHGDFVRQLARRLLADEHEAEDVAQDAWVRYFEAAPRGLLDPRSWFTAVVANLARNRQRSRARRSDREQHAARPETLDAADASLAEASALQALAQAVVELDEPYRSTVVARYFKGHEPSRIARDTGVPLATVKSRLQRAHVLLRERLDRRHGGRAAWSVALGALLDPARTSDALLAASAAKVAITACVLLALVWSTWRVTDPVLRDAGRTHATAAAPASEEPALERAHAPAHTREVAAFDRPTKLRVRGRVRDLAYAPSSFAGGPARGVDVTIAPSGARSGRSSPTTPVHATTDAEGAFVAELECGDAPFEHLRVGVDETELLRGASVELDLAPGATDCDGLELTRAAHGFVEGTVVDTDGVGVPFAKLELQGTSATTPSLSVTADAAGRVRALANGWLRSVKSLDAGAVLVGWSRPKILPAGGQSGLRVVLARSTSLRVRVTDARGTPLDRLMVRVELDPSEKRRIADPSFDLADVASEATAADGVATFASVLAEHRLRVVVDGERSASVRGDELLFGPAADGGAPLVLAAGTTRELRAVWFANARVSGAVVDESGRGVRDVDVELFELPPSEGGAAIRCARARSDAAGRYALAVRRRELAGPVRIVASTPGAGGTRDVRGLAANASAAPNAPDTRIDSVLGRSRDARELEAAAFSGGDVRVDFVLAPARSIVGRVVDREGAPLDGSRGGLRLAIARSGQSAYVADRDASTPDVEWHAGGRFEIAGLAPGRYDLFLSRVDSSFYTWAHGTQVFRDVEAGAPERELRYDPGDAVRVRVRITGERIDGGIVLRAHLAPRDPALAIEPADRVQRIDEASGWPEHAPFGFTGISGGVDERGAWNMGLDGLDEDREIELPPMSPGAYVIGLAPSRSGAPLATPLRVYASGEYTIELAVRATTRLEGTVIGDTTSQRIGVELVDASGGRVTLESEPGFARPTKRLELDARGRFVVERAPLGVYTLRIGRLDELRAGNARLEQRVELTRDEPTRVELALP